MRIAARFRRVSCPPLLLSLCALLILAAPCLAVTMRVTVGFDGVQKQSVWTPVAVQLSNPTEDNIEGNLLVSLPGYGRTPMPMCTAAVNLPGHSTKLYHAYVRLSGYGGKMRVALVRGYGTLAYKEANINSASAEDKVIVTVGDRSSRLSYLQGETVSVPPTPRRYGPGGPSGGSTTANIEAGSIAADLLPDRPAAYEGIDVLVVSGLVPDSTNPNVLRAISAWVASGGTLVVSTGPDYRAYKNAFYDELLPVKVQGAANVDGLPGLAQFGHTAFPAGAAAVTQSAIKPGTGQSVVVESGMPTMAVRQYGAGRVVFLAFDYRTSPFADWNGKTEFWKSIVKGSSGKPIVPTETRFAGEGYYSYGGSSYGGQDESAAFKNVVSQTPSVKTPSVNTIGLFLLAYLIVLVPANYIVLRRRRRLELAWLTTPAIVILFTIGAYAIGYTMKGGSLRLCEATVIEASAGARYGRAVTDASLFSPARRSYDVAIADPSAISQMIATGPTDEPPVTYLADTSVMPRCGHGDVVIAHVRIRRRRGPRRRDRGEAQTGRRRGQGRDHQQHGGRFSRLQGRVRRRAGGYRAAAQGRDAAGPADTGRKRGNQSRIPRPQCSSADKARQIRHAPRDADRAPHAGGIRRCGRRQVRRLQQQPFGRAIALLHRAFGLRGR